MELWKDITGYEGTYQVSSLGRVRNIKKKGKILLPLYRDGYTRYRLNKNNKQLKYAGHRLVALMFIPNPENLPEVHHKNGVRDDNRVDNLAWVGREDNMNKQFFFKDLDKKTSKSLAEYLEDAADKTGIKTLEEFIRYLKAF